MTPGFWLNLQARWDLYRAQREEEADLAGIQPLAAMGGPRRSRRGST